MDSEGLFCTLCDTSRHILPLLWILIDLTPSYFTYIGCCVTFGVQIEERDITSYDVYPLVFYKHKIFLLFVISFSTPFIPARFMS